MIELISVRISIENLKKYRKVLEVEYVRAIISHSFQTSQLKKGQEKRRVKAWKFYHIKAYQLDSAANEKFH